MKRFLTILSLILAMMMLVSCGKEADPDAPEGMTEISNDKVGYHLYVPDGWTAETSTGVITAKFRDTTVINVSMTTNSNSPETPDVESFWEAHSEDLERMADDVEILEEDTEVLLDGHEAKKYVYTCTVNTLKMKYQQVICLEDGVFYIFTYTSPEDKYDDCTADVEKMLENFAFKD